MKKWLITLVGLCVSAIAIALVVSKAELRVTASLIAGVGYRVPVALAAMYLATFPIRALRWQCMLPAGTMSFVDALKGVLIGFAGNNFLPTRGGEFLRMEYMYRKAPQIGRITAISSILVERMLDGLTLLAILVIALHASHIDIGEHHWLGELRYVALAVFGLACAGWIVIRAWGGRIAALLRRTHLRPFHWAATMVDRFHVAAEFLGFNPHTVMTVLLGFCVWIVEGGVVVVACRHYGLGVESVVAGYLTLAIVNFGLLVPSSPGNIGVYQYMTILALNLFGVAHDTALALSIVVHACQYVPTTLAGSAVLLRESLGWHRRRPDAAHELAAPHTIGSEIQSA
jgi:glycosyltransferase 2 family protein